MFFLNMAPRKAHVVLLEIFSAQPKGEVEREKLQLGTKSGRNLL